MAKQRTYRANLKGSRGKKLAANGVCIGLERKGAAKRCQNIGHGGHAEHQTQQECCSPKHKVDDTCTQEQCTHWRLGKQQHVDLTARWEGASRCRLTKRQAQHHST